MNQVKNPFSFKEIFVYVGHNERRTNIFDEGKPGQEDELWKRGKMAEKESGGWVGVARRRYFSHYSCLVFMVFDRAWSLSPALSLLSPSWLRLEG